MTSSPSFPRRRASSTWRLRARVLVVLVTILLASGSPVGAASPSAAAPALLDAAADRLQAKVVIPEPARKVGEVRLLSRAGAVVVQTLLSTKLLARVIGEIRKKEEANWPAAAAGRDDAVAYLEALEAVRAAVERRSPAVDWADRRRRLLIEFVADAAGQAVLLGTFTTASGTTDLTPASREVLGTLTPSRAYVLRNMRLILSDSFKIPEAEVDRIGPLGPAAGAATVEGVSGSSVSDGAPVGAPVAPDVDTRPATEATGR
jgi:hypothetical protein